MPRTDPCVLRAWLRARARAAEAWPGLRFSNEITALERGGKEEKNWREGKERGVKREEGHLVVICVCQLAPVVCEAAGRTAAVG